MIFLLLPTICFVMALVLTYRLTLPTARLQILDRPNQRSLHTRPVPRTGGLAILAAIATGWILFFFSWDLPDEMVWIMVGAILVASISIIDDCHPLPARWRFLVHLLAIACLLPAGLVWQQTGLPFVDLPIPYPLAVIVTLLGGVWMINLYNFMDGMDGLAAGMASAGFSGMALLAALAGAADFAFLSLVVAASAGGFLVWNFPPARIFMGDGGSSVLGFLVIAFALWADQRGLFPLWQALLLFSPFVVDASTTLARRLFRGEKIWQAHKEHAYQQLVESGWGHRRTLLAIYWLILLCLGMTVLAANLGPAGQSGVILATVLMYGLIWRGVRRRLGRSDGA